MRLKVEITGAVYELNLDSGLSIAIDLDFDGQQPSHFGADKATRSPMTAGSFVGRTEKGGGCNVDVIRLNPHCNGTHTETVGHIVDESVNIANAATSALFSTLVVSVQPVPAIALNETYRPELESKDVVITRETLQAAVDQSTSKSLDGIEALVVRTIPNNADKCSRVYDDKNQPAFFTVEATQYVNELAISHLLVDVPSIDRVFDEGLLTNHHLFWKIPERTSAISNTVESKKTITEMIYVPDGVADGFYLLNLQVPAFCSDAAPSRPILFSLSEIENG